MGRINSALRSQVKTSQPETQKHSRRKSRVKRLGEEKIQISRGSESRALKVLMHLRKTEKIIKEVDNISPATTEKMVTAVLGCDWENPIFYHSKSYSVLYRAYQIGSINEEQFQGAQGLLQLYTQSGVRTDLPLS